jgi:hypothetical protein
LLSSATIVGPKSILQFDKLMERQEIIDSLKTLSALSIYGLVTVYEEGTLVLIFSSISLLQRQPLFGYCH